MFFRFPWVPWALEPWSLQCFFSFFLLFFFFLESPYQAATNPAFSGHLGPREPSQKISWNPKDEEAEPFLCILKNTRMYCKKQGIGPFWPPKNPGLPPLSQVNRFFKKRTKTNQQNTNQKRRINENMFCNKIRLWSKLQQKTQGRITCFASISQKHKENQVFSILNFPDRGLICVLRFPKLFWSFCFPGPLMAG